MVSTIDVFGDFTVALAAFYNDNLAFLDLQNTGSLLGAGATASEVRLNEFQKALLRYQNALIALNKQKGVGRGASASRITLENEVRSAYAELQKKYQTELKKVAPANSLGKNRGNALAGADRGITLARRRGRGINVASNAQALQIARMAKGISYAGKGLIALDAGIRVNKVRNVHRQGGNWQREATIQTTGFGLGAATGMFIGKVAVAGLTTIGLGFTPVGWVVLIGAGVVVGFGAAMAMDNVGQSVAATIWDRKWKLPLSL
ncbi:hypothetical protein DWB84_03805 [Saccharophagus sp. K07]|uniref:hypothetical protein n=1 Tax=Saccharophagus sp. K07 TaxID=2283636 RepID=UPI001651B916|nr:hypothetical protein [Saccharophagus sp. K07]MBC6904590.1 hypothetical protein [Saccharophagus sp. K07]